MRNIFFIPLTESLNFFFSLNSLGLFFNLDLVLYIGQAHTLCALLPFLLLIRIFFCLVCI